MKTETQQEDVEMPSSENTSTNQEATVSNNDGDKPTEEKTGKPVQSAQQTQSLAKQGERSLSAFLAASDPRDIAEKRKINQAVALGQMTREQAEEVAKRPRRPGALQMASDVTLHSQLGVALFVGRRGDKPKGLSPIVGLTRFAKRVVEIWRASSEDDPYADHVLLDIEDAYEIAKKRLEKMSRDVRLAMDDYIDMDFSDTAMKSKKPTVVQAEFHCAWAWRGLKLVKQYDDLVKLALGGKHIGLYTEEDWTAIVHETGRGIRHMFLQGEYWIYTGIGRENVVEGDRFAKEAYEKYIKRNRNGYLLIDGDVISGARRAKLAPKIIGNPRADRLRALKMMKDKADDEEKRQEPRVIVKKAAKTSQDTGKSSSKETLKLKKSAAKES